MSYDTYEQSVENGRPKYRVLFAFGSYEYRYTNDEFITADSNGAWIPEAIELGEFSQTNEMAKDPLQITLPIANQLATHFLGGVPEHVVSVTVFRWHTNDEMEEYRFYWKGRVAGASADGDAVTLSCENVYTSMRRPGLRAKYQRTCRHPLYFGGCGVDKNAFAVSATVTAVSGAIVTVVYSDSNAGGDYFSGGMLETADGDFRYIIVESGATLTLMRPLQALDDEVNSSAGEALVTLYPGCNHQMEHCKDRFNNLANHGAFPWIPSKNPFANDVSGSIA